MPQIEILQFCFKLLLFQPFPPFPKSAVSQWFLLYNSRLQLETSSDDSKGVKSPGVIGLKGFMSCAGIIPSPPDKRRRQQQLLSMQEGEISPSEPQVCGWNFKSPLHFPQPHKTAAGRQTKHQTQQKTWSSQRKVLPSQPKKSKLSQSALNLIRHVIFSFYRWKCH